VVLLATGFTGEWVITPRSVTRSWQLVATNNPLARLEGSAGTAVDGLADEVEDRARQVSVGPGPARRGRVPTGLSDLLVLDAEGVSKAASNDLSVQAWLERVRELDADVAVTAVAELVRGVARDAGCNRGGQGRGRVAG